MFYSSSSRGSMKASSKQRFLYSMLCMTVQNPHMPIHVVNDNPIFYCHYLVPAAGALGRIHLVGILRQVPSINRRMND